MAEEVKVSKARNFRKGFIRFFKDVRSELKKVIWPTRAQVINNTVTVLTSCLLVGAVIWISDGVLGQLIKLLVTR